MARTGARRPRTRAKQRPRGRGWILLPVILLALMLVWLYRGEIVGLVTFGFEGADFSRRPADRARNEKGGGRITAEERGELEKILRDR